MQEDALEAFKKMSMCIKRMDEARCFVQCNGIMTRHISPTVMSVTPLPLCCFVTWHVEFFFVGHCNGVEFERCCCFLLFILLCEGGSLTRFNGFHFCLSTWALGGLLGVKEKLVDVNVVTIVVSWIHKENHHKIS
jgi:hypothetical protein